LQCDRYTKVTYVASVAVYVILYYNVRISIYKILKNMPEQLGNKLQIVGSESEKKSKTNWEHRNTILQNKQCPKKYIL